jgi:hypothetical protein
VHVLFLCLGASVLVEHGNRVGVWDVLEQALRTSHHQPAVVAEEFFQSAYLTANRLFGAVNWGVDGLAAILPSN